MNPNNQVKKNLIFLILLILLIIMSTIVHANTILEKQLTKCEEKGKYRDLCYKLVAKSRNDKAICNYIEDIEEKEKCVKIVDYEIKERNKVILYIASAIFLFLLILFIYLIITIRSYSKYS